MAANLITKAEAAELLDVTPRRIEQRAGELGATPVGKARQYDVAKLPIEAQKAWAVQPKVVEIAPSHTPGQLALSLTIPSGPNLSAEDRAQAEHRYNAIEPLLHPERYPLLLVQHRRRSDLVNFLCAQHSVKPRTLYDWLARWKEGGLPGLVSKDRSDKGSSRALNAAAKDFLLAAAMPRKGVYGVLSVREIFRAYEEERIWRASHAGKIMGDFEQSKYARYLDEDYRLRDTAQLPLVSYETFRVWFNRIPEVARTMAREGGEAYRNTQEIISFRELTAIDPLEYVVMDHRVLDIFCLAPERGGWRLIRPWLTAAIDMRTRKWLAWAIVETPSSDSIATVLKRVFIDHGIPQNLYWDNGKDFRCEWFEGRRIQSEQSAKVGDLSSTWRGVLGTLGIRVTHAIVRNARAKIIEPNFGRISKFDETLPEFCGHKPTQRPEGYEQLVKQHEAWLEGKRDRTPFKTIQYIASLYERAIQDLNERPLEGEGMQKVLPTGRGWNSPNEAWEILTEKLERRTIDANLIHFCFAKRRELTVKHGEVKTSFGGRDYHYRLTGNDLLLMALNGQVVEFAYDPFDLGEAAIYYQSRFVGLAECIQLRRMGESAFVDDEKSRRHARREVKKFIEAVHQAVPVPSPEERLNRRKEVIPTRSSYAPTVTLPECLPAAVVEAEAASRSASQQTASALFSDAAVETVQAAVQQPATGSNNNDDEFVFFRGN